MIEIEREMVMKNQFDEEVEFNYEIKKIIKNGAYQHILHLLNAQEKALCNTLAIPDTTLESVSKYYGISIEEAKSILKNVFLLYNRFYEEIKDKISYDRPQTTRNRK